MAFGSKRSMSKPTATLGNSSRDGGSAKSSLSTAAISQSTISTILRVPHSFHNSQSQRLGTSSHRLHRGDQFWNVNFDERALAGAALDLQMKIGAVEYA